MNAIVDGLEVDAVWHAARVAVELDGWEFHRHRRAFQRDREKANALTTAGWTVLRFTHHDVVHRPAGGARAAQARRRAVLTSRAANSRPTSAIPTRTPKATIASGEPRSSRLPPSAT